MKRITVTLTEDQLRELREIVRWHRVKIYQDHLRSPRFDKESEIGSFVKRIESILAEKLAKS